MNPEVYEAAKSGDFDSLEAIISGKREDIFHQTTPKENNILHVAAQYKQVNFIRQILQYSSGPSLLWQGNCKGETPLHLAAKAGSWEAVQVFINLAKSLHWVVENGQVVACKGLLRKPNSHKDTVLHYALRGGHDGVVKLLIDEDCQLCNITNAAEESPLYLAAHRGLPLITDLILRVSPLSLSHKGPKGMTALHATIYRPKTNRRKIMRKRPKVIREADDIGWTPLHYYASYGWVNSVKALLQYNTSAAYDIDKEGQSALHIAAFCGHVNVIDELLRSRPDVCDIMNTEGQTALHAAILGGQVNVVKYTLGMPNLEDIINEQDTDGNTALHLAALHKQYKIIYILAQEKRVDRLATNKDHLTALDIFWAYDEVGYRAAKVKHVLGISNGSPFRQGWEIENIKKRLDKQFAEGQRAVPVTAESNTANRENDDSSKRTIIEIQLLAAVLIATVTFTATFTMPGGYNNDGPNQGLATLAGRAAFQAFVISNTTSFGFSVLALFLLFHTALGGGSVYQRRFAGTAAECIVIAICGMALAFGCGTYAVLARTIGVGIFPLVLTGCLATVYGIGCILYPNCLPGWVRPSFVIYVRNLMFDYGIL
ncbi:hypothetical protein EUGRSUZ_D01537 [Eucalyptus grandis]|uniref:Uncharacterized protein n=1 Tax=Eucalyptus grandis TaxID=71139 RepID=A0ACC3L5X8_EUCGR|nr:hypothetical protein EUGRSUZ_D01537 [Eucalyptus grandis]